MAPPASEKLKVRCPCGTKLAVPLAARGRKVKCPSCEKSLRIPEAAPAQAAAPSRPPVSAPVAAGAGDGLGLGDDMDLGMSDDIFAGLSEGAATEAPAAGGGDVAGGGRCPSCGANMAPGASLCTKCGLNINTGKKQKLAAAKTRKPVAVPKFVLGGSKLLLGSVLCLVGAVLGACIWFGIFVTTHWEIGFVAWGVGALTGLGMIAAKANAGFIGGLIASGLAVGGLALARLMIIAYYLSSAASGILDDPSNRLDLVAGDMAEKRIIEQGLDPDDVDEEIEEAEYYKAYAEVEEMSEEQLEEEWQRVRAEKEEVIAAASATVATAFFTHSLTRYDIIWAVLAVATAFKFGSAEWT